MRVLGIQPLAFEAELARRAASHAERRADLSARLEQCRARTAALQEDLTLLRGQAAPQVSPASRPTGDDQRLRRDQLAQELATLQHLRQTVAEQVQALIRETASRLSPPTESPHG